MQDSVQMVVCSPLLSVNLWGNYKRKTLPYILLGTLHTTLVARYYHVALPFRFLLHQPTDWRVGKGTTRTLLLVICIADMSSEATPRGADGRDSNRR